MATKAELEQLHNSYSNSTAQVAEAEARHDYHGAIELAEASLPLVHPAVTFQRRFLKSDRLIAPTVDALLRIAPALFLRRSLDVLEQWYLTGTRAERNSLPDVMERVEAARLLLVRAIELWSCLAATPRSCIRLDYLREHEAGILTLWLNAGMVARLTRGASARYGRVSDPRRLVEGKCTQCGGKLVAPLTHLLDLFRCPTCRQRCEFIVTRQVD